MSGARPRIFHLVTSLDYGGTENFLKQLALGLRNRYDFSFGVLKREGALAQELRAQGFSVRRFPTLLQLAFHLRREKPDLMHTHMYRANVVGRVVGKLCGVKVVSSQRSSDAWKKIHHVWLDRITAHAASAIVANCEATKRLLIEREKIPASKITVVPNGVEDIFSQPRVPEKAKESFGFKSKDIVVGTIGRFHQEKGAQHWPAIFERVWKSNPDAKFLLVGDGPEKPALLKLQEKNPSRLVLTGYRSDPLSALSAMDVFLLPSSEESFSQSVLEAMAQGIPIVASRVGGMPELVDTDAGFLFPPGDIVGFASGVAALAIDPALRRHMGAHAKKITESFSLPLMLTRLDALYQKWV